RPGRGCQLRVDERPGGLSRAGEPRQGEPEEAFDQNFGVTVRTFSKRAWFEADVAVAPDAAPGPRTIAGRAVFMICNANLRLPPTPLPFGETVVVESEIGRAHV